MSAAAERDEDIAPAIKRAYASGKPGVVHVAADPKTNSEEMPSPGTRGLPARGHAEPQALPDPGPRRRAGPAAGRAHGGIMNELDDSPPT